MKIPVLRGLLLLPLLAVVAPAADTGLSLVRVFTGWRDAASFKRISEYFDGQENTGGQVVLRSQPASRDGYYFLARVANPGTGAAIRLRLTVILPAVDKPREFTFAATADKGDTVFNLGLTGTDWKDKEASPVAWKLDILPAEGDGVLASQHSYLWDRPASK